MSRARLALTSAAIGGGAGLAGLGAAGLVSYGLLKVEARLARRTIGKPFDTSPDDTNLYGAGLGAPLHLVVLGDSLAAGLGADTRYQTMGGILATGVSALAGRPVQLTNVAEVGAESPWLDGQVRRALQAVPHPDVALISIGGNDVTHRIPTAVSVSHLRHAVVALRASGAEVVVGTCPDLGTIEPLAQPLRTLAKHWSRELATAQTVAVVEAGGRTVSLGDLLRPDFLSAPEHLFSADRFHPSAAGYARAASRCCRACARHSGCGRVRPDGDRTGCAGNASTPSSGPPPRRHGPPAARSPPPAPQARAAVVSAGPCSCGVAAPTAHPSTTNSTNSTRSATP